MTKRQSSEYFATNHYISTLVSHLSKSVADIPDPEYDKEIRPVGTCAKEGASFLVPLLYLGACIADRIHAESPSSETLQNVDLTRYVLGIFNTRWKAAGKFSSLKNRHCCSANAVSRSLFESSRSKTDDRCNMMYLYRPMFYTSRYFI